MWDQYSSPGKTWQILLFAAVETVHSLASCSMIILLSFHQLFELRYWTHSMRMPCRYYHRHLLKKIYSDPSQKMLSIVSIQYFQLKNTVRISLSIVFRPGSPDILPGYTDHRHDLSYQVIHTHNIFLRLEILADDTDPFRYHS